MTPTEFTAAKAKLGLSYSQLAAAIGKSPRATMGYAAGQTIPRDVEIIIGLLLSRTTDMANSNQGIKASP